MFDIVPISRVARILFICIFSYFINIKIINYRNNSIIKTLLILVISALISVLYIFLIKYLLPVGAFTISYIVYGIMVNSILKANLKNFFISTIIAIILAYIIHLISTLISGTILRIIIPSIDYKTPISLITIPLIETMILIIMFKTKRFKYGFNFLRNVNINKNILIFTMIFSTIIIFIFGFLQRYNTIALDTCLAIGTIFIAISLAIVLKDKITQQYKSNMRDRTIEIQKREIDENLKIIEDLKQENFKLAESIHKYNSRISALELSLKNTIEQNSNTEFAEELSVILNEANEIDKGFLKETQVIKTKLPSTNIIGIDNMFKYMQQEAVNSNINYDLKLNESINNLLEIIDKEKFETLIGDHLKDAIIAVNASTNTYKSILVTLGIVEDCYEFSVIDTGIEFKIETLLKLGLEQTTTHKETGGSGIGFMTTFKTLKECRASLIIEEYNPNVTSYTKSVTIRFDGKSQYKIISYRAEEIKKQNKKERKIIIKNKN